MIITIDGPASSGKSTAARALARHFNLYYLSSGMLYRACAYILHRYAHYSEKTIAKPTRGDIILYCNSHRITYTYSLNHGVQIFFDKQDITSHLKSAIIDAYVSLISVNDVLRAEVLIMQKNIVAERDVVAEGRDMGSVVFPHAEYKFFLTASVDERALRWQKDQEQKGESVDQERAVQMLSERDHRDTNRLHAPLSVPFDAMSIDTTDLSSDQVIQIIVQYIENKNR